MSEIEYSAGEVIFRQGYPAPDAYIIESGRVEIYIEELDGSETQLAILGPGQLFGEMGPMDEKPRNASARALEDTVLTIAPLP